MHIAFPHPPGGGGPGSFQKRFEKELKKSGYSISYAHESILPDIVMVIGGTKRLGWLWKMKFKGVPIVYRLDGINWLHRKKNVGVKKFLLGEIRNYLSQIIRNFIADHLIYQSQFVKNWWEKEGWRKINSYSIIYNGVDLEKFKLTNNEDAKLSIICLEGKIDYTPYAIELLNQIQQRFQGSPIIKLYGEFENEANKHELNTSISYEGYVQRDKVADIFRNGIFLSLDINPACPNTVIEALASGIPVVGFDTGSLKELVPSQAGKVVPYGSNPWRLEFPNIDALTKAIKVVLNDWERYSAGAYEIAKQRYDMNDIYDSYYRTLDKVLKSKC